MKLEDARQKLNKIVGIKFKDLYSRKELKGIKIAKGNTGKLLEKIIGLTPGNTLRDFEDGELKTNKAKIDGSPMETMFISQISSRVDELLNKISFNQSWIYNKIARLIYVPVVKAKADPDEWYFLKHYFIKIERGDTLYKQLENDFNVICEKMIDDIENGDGFIHTSSGKYIQIRTKNAKPYNPIFSNKYGKEISNKNFAFYFKKDFMNDIQSLFS